MNIGKLKVGTRLTAGFGCLCMLLVATLVFGVGKLADMNQAMSAVVDKRLPKLEQSYLLVAQVERIRIALRDMMLDPDPAERARQRETIMAARATIKRTVEDMERTVVTPEGVALLKTLIERRLAFVAGQDVLLAHIEAGRDEQALAYMGSTLQALQRDYKQSLEQMQALQRSAMTAAAEQAQLTYRESRNWLLGLGGLSLVLSVAIGVAISRSLLKQLGGEPAYAAAIADEIAAGNLAVEVAVAGHDRSSLLYAIGRMRTQLAELVQGVRNGTDTIHTGSGEIAAGNQELSARTEQQASALEETASSMEELTSTVRQNADNARQADELARAAEQAAEHGGRVVAQVVEKMSAINASSRKVADIIGVIDGIAFQTNILALNASVEAARAGELGRGFAVVAGEVRTLAQRSATAAREIRGLIDRSVLEIEAGAQLVDQAGSATRSIVDGVRQVSGIVRAISVASGEQSAGIEQINEAVLQLDAVTQQNAALVEEAAAASAAMQEQAQSLSTLVGTFRLEPRPAPARDAGDPSDAGHAREVRRAPSPVRTAPLALAA